MTREVIPAFDMLLEELEAIIPMLTEQVNRLMLNRDLVEAQNVLNRAKYIESFQARVKDLLIEWKSKNFPSTKDEDQFDEQDSVESYSTNHFQLESMPKSRALRRRLKPGLRTSQEELKIPILQALVDLGGRAEYSELIKRLSVTLTPKLNKFDFEPLPSDPNSIRWQNNIGWSKTPLRKAGYIRADTPIGIWELTDKGYQLAIGKAPTPLFEKPYNAQPKSSLTKTYDLNHHFNNKSAFTRRLFTLLKGEILKIDNRVEERFNKMCVKYHVNGEGFVDIHLQQEQLKIWIRPKPSELVDPFSMARDVSNLGHYGVGDSEINLSSINELPSALNLIKQSFDWLLTKKKR